MGGANINSEPNVASDAFDFTGERAPVPRAPQMESVPAQVAAGVYNGAIAPTLDFMASPLGLATSAVPFAGQTASRIASAAFAPVAFGGMEEARQKANEVAKDPNATLQQKVEPIVEAASQGLMGIGAAKHAIPAPELGKLGITPKGRTAQSMDEIDRGLEEAAKPLPQKFPTSEQGFYSQLQKTIDEKMPNSSSVQQLMAIIDPAKGSGVKPDEIKWSNLESFLEGKDKVNKQEVLNYLKNKGSLQLKQESASQNIMSPELRDWLEYREDGIPETSRQWESAIENLNVHINDLEESGASDDQLAEYDDLHSELHYLSENPHMDVQTKYHTYQIPNGENYREIILTNPNDPSNYESPHFQGTKNYVAHMRLNDRTDADGRGTFIEELQSDRHQQGREKGYKENITPKQMPDGTWEVTYKDGSKKIFKDERSANNSIKTAYYGDVPDAPFRKDWSVQLFKRALQDAVNNGKDWIGWTTGDTQAERYDLSKQVKDLYATPNQDGTFSLAITPEGGMTGISRPLADNIHPDKLADYVGKELAEKIAQQDSSKVYSGPELKVGGEGMKGFYDQILPKEIGKYVGKFGGKAEQSQMITAKQHGGQKTHKIWKIKITPEMKKAIQAGQPQVNKDTDIFAGLA